MPNEEYQLPTVLLSVDAAKRRHPGEPDAVLDDPKQLAVGKPLRFRQAQIRRLWVQTFTVQGIAAAIVGVTRRAMIREVPHWFSQSLIGRHDGIVLAAGIRRYCQAVGVSRQHRFHSGRCGTSAEAVVQHRNASGNRQAGGQHQQEKNQTPAFHGPRMLAERS